ncbi:hypothetical protein Aperf_G00000052486 [Anoplocephala perfoliata]
MSSQSLSQDIGRGQLLDLHDVRQNFTLSGKLEVWWNSCICTELQALNEELPSLGLKQYLKNLDSQLLIVNFNSLVSAFYELFQRYMHDLNSRGDLDVMISRVKADLEYSRTMHQRCKEDLQVVQSSLNLAKEHERRFETEKTALSNEIRFLKDSIRRQQSGFQTRNAQFQHEIQKLQRENNSLKTRINALLQKPMSSSRRPPVLTQERTENLKSQLDLTRYALDHLRTRENELFHENRELRDLVSILSTRMFRFSRHLQNRRMHRIDDDEEDFEGLEETSLDGSRGFEEVETSSDSSIEENSTNALSRRRESADIHHLLLEMPFHMVRDRLIRRVHRLSRRLWKEIKDIGHIEDGSSPIDQSGDHLTIKRHLQEKLVDYKVKLAECEELKNQEALLTEFNSLTAGGEAISAQNDNKIDQTETDALKFQIPNGESPECDGSDVKTLNGDGNRDPLERRRNNNDDMDDMLDSLALLFAVMGAAFLHSV